MLKTIIETFVVFSLLFLVFRLVEFTRPSAKRMPFLRRGLTTDLGYVAIVPLVSKAVKTLVLLFAIVPFAFFMYGKVDKDLILNGFGPLSRLPLPLQSLGILIVSDLTGYWVHRAFHRGRLWRFHAVHHSSVDLEWLSSVRVHPVNELLQRIAILLPVLLLGFAPLAAIGALPVFTLFAILLHANVDWDFGPLRAVIASPRFHRWHHTDEREARDKNFSGLFPAWDILFGTYYMPRDRLPSRFGTSTPVPDGLWGQIAFPFRRTNGV